MRKGKGLVAAAALVAAGGSASTASNTMPDSTAGYGTSSISGATATSLDFTVSADGQTITGAGLLFIGDQRNSTIKAGFGTGTSVTCTIGTFTLDSDLLTDGNQSTTAVTCGTFAQAVASSSTFNVSVVS